MSDELNDPTPERLPDSSPSDIQFTARELAILEDRDPDAVEETPAPEAEQQPEVAEVTAEAPADEPEPKSWVEDYDRTVAAALSLSDDDLSDFGSRDEFSKFVRKYSQIAQRQPRQEAPAAKQEPATPAKPAEYVDEAIVDGKVNVEWYRKNGYDEGTIKYYENQREWQDRIERETKEQADRYSQYEERLAAEEQQRQLNAFHHALDSHRPDFYGKSLDQFGNVNTLSPSERNRRTEILDEVSWMVERIVSTQQAGNQPIALPSYQYLVAQAEQRLFGVELLKADQEKKAAAAAAQSRAIRPAAGSTGAGHARRTAVVTSDDPAELNDDPDIVAAWEKAAR